jgi:hypothetical protein
MAFSVNTQWNKDYSTFENPDIDNEQDGYLMRRKSQMEKYFGYDNKGASAFRGSKGNYAAIFGLTIIPRSDIFSYDGGRLRIPFQYITENLPTLTKTANYEDTNIPGRFEGIANYTYSNTTDIQLDLTYVAESKKANIVKKVSEGEKFQDETQRAQSNPLGFIADKIKEKDVGKNKKNNIWTLEYINSLIPLYESLTYPQYDERYNPPNLCLLNIGSVFMDVPILIKTVSVAHKQPYDTQTMMPRSFQITLDARVSYPLYQAISSREIIDKSTSVLPRSVYMRKTITASRYKKL